MLVTFVLIILELFSCASLLAANQISDSNYRKTKRSLYLNIVVDSLKEAVRSKVGHKFGIHTIKKLEHVDEIEDDHHGTDSDQETVGIALLEAIVDPKVNHKKNKKDKKHFGALKRHIQHRVGLITKSVAGKVAESKSGMNRITKSVSSKLIENVPKKLREKGMDVDLDLCYLHKNLIVIGVTLKRVYVREILLSKPFVQSLIPFLQNINDKVKFVLNKYGRYFSRFTMREDIRRTMSTKLEEFENIFEERIMVSIVEIAMHDKIAEKVESIANKNGAKLQVTAMRPRDEAERFFKVAAQIKNKKAMNIEDDFIIQHHVELIELEKK